LTVEFIGEPILIDFRPRLRAYRGDLFCGGARGSEVHAASFLRERRIVLDSVLLRNRAEHDRILSHEIFHFAWYRAPRLRASYEGLVAGELERAVCGEAGWSAEWRKGTLCPQDRAARSRRWKDYVCESFCDTGALFVCGLPSHEELTLPRRALARRRKWFEEHVEGGRLRI